MIGSTLGHYKVLEKIGSGGMGDVYLGEDATLHRRVALKVLPPGLAGEGERPPAYMPPEQGKRRSLTLRGLRGGLKDVIRHARNLSRSHDLEPVRSEPPRHPQHTVPRFNQTFSPPQ